MIYDTRCAIGIVTRSLPKEDYVIVAVPLGFGMLRISNLRGYMAHAVPLVFVANFFVKSSNISVCAVSRLNLVTFRFSAGCRCAIGIVTK